MAESHTSPSPQPQAQHDASKDHHVDPKDAPASNVSPYVANILDSSVCDSLWIAIEGDVAVTSAHCELASRRQSNNTQPYAMFLLNALSLSASTSASPDDTDDAYAVLFDSAAHHIARGDSRGDACTSDWVAVQVPLRELRGVVRHTMTTVETGSELAVKAEGGKFVQECVPCIESGDALKHPYALLVDLDHSTEYKSGERIGTGARVRTGTPMFMACELSSSSRDAALHYPHSSILHLESQLEAVENPGAVFRRAFPDDDGTFMKQFRLVLEAEEQRRKTNGKAFTNPKTPHLPRYDVESAFWVLVWCFARACPVGAPFEDEKNGEFSNWAHNMLKHTIGNESARWTLLGGAQILKTILHPDLASFSDLLADIAAYLVVPWDLYHDIVDDDHVHIAIRRLLLAQIHALNNNPTLDVQLNTMQPRVINLQSHTDYVSQPSRDYVSPWASAATRPPSLASAMTVQTGSGASAAPDVPSSVHDGSGASTGRPKRSAPDGDTTKPKKSKTTVKKKRNAKAQDGPDAQSAPYSALSAAVRCENLWDSWLWFAIGRRGKASVAELESRPSAP